LLIASADALTTLSSLVVLQLHLLQNLQRRLSTNVASHGTWPQPLHTAVDTEQWALSGADGAVLAAALHTGSLLVRALTWNLQAKPTASAEVLRQQLLPPLQVIT
jgi:hypothetical protein